MEYLHWMEKEIEYNKRKFAETGFDFYTVKADTLAFALAMFKLKDTSF